MSSENLSANYRSKVINCSKRIVIKIGSRLLTDIVNSSAQTRIDQVISKIAQIRQKGYEIILVTSAAISMGMEQRGIIKRPRDLPRLQALAAVGQSMLMSIYENTCQNHGFHCAQILLSYDDLKNRERHLNVCNCINALMNQSILPIINENDAVSVEEISFGDNDKLAALVATMIRADLTILLTNVDGLMAEDEHGKFRRNLSVAHKIDDEMKAIAKGTDGNSISSGGMISKIEAAEICLSAGESLWIANGLDFNILDQIFEAADVGTLFYSKNSKLSGSKMWLAFFTEPRGELIVDQGAVSALRYNGKSLLPSGIIKSQGMYNIGDTVKILTEDNSDVGMGIINYHSEQIELIKRKQTSELNRILGKRVYDEVVHRNNMVIYA